MPTTSFDKESIKKSILGKLQRYNGRTIQEATTQQIYKAVASTVRDQIMQKYLIAREERKETKTKRLYYLSVEFLMGRSLYCNMLNLVSTDVYREALAELGIDVIDLLKEDATTSCQCLTGQEQNWQEKEQMAQPYWPIHRKQ